MKLLKISAAASALTLFACEIRERPDELMPDSSTSATRLLVGEPFSGEIISVGAASAEFTPSTPVALSGFGGLDRRFFPPLIRPDGDLSFCKPFEKIDNPPRIKAAVFKIKTADGKIIEQFLISLDVVAVTRDLTEKIHQLISSLNGEVQANLTNTVVLATHTHSGPAGLTQNPLWSAFVCDQFNPDLSSDYLNTLKQVVTLARSKNTTIHQIETRQASLPELFKSRMDSMKSNPEVTLLAFKNENGSLPFSLVQLAAHPTFWGPRDLVLSADLVAPIENAVRRRTGSDELFLTQTEVGNMDAMLGTKNPNEWADSIAASLTDEKSTSSSGRGFASLSGFISLASPKLNWQGCGAKSAEHVVSLPILQQLPDSLPYTLWSLNGSIYLFLSGEWTTAAADVIRSSIAELFPRGSRITIFSLANDYTGYHLPRSDYTTQSIEACSSIYGIDALEKLTNDLRSAAENSSFSALQKK